MVILPGLKHSVLLLIGFVLDSRELESSFSGPRGFLFPAFTEAP